jgi:hypothetical protein
MGFFQVSCALMGFTPEKLLVWVRPGLWLRLPLRGFLGRDSRFCVRDFLPRVKVLREQFLMVFPEASYSFSRLFFSFGGKESPWKDQGYLAFSSLAVLLVSCVLNGYYPWFASVITFRMEVPRQSCVLRDSSPSGGVSRGTRVSRGVSPSGDFPKDSRSAMFSFGSSSMSRVVGISRS